MARDHRRHRRYDVDDVQGSLVHELDARVLNMSLTGMAIETRTLLKVGGKYWLRLPNEDGTLRLPAHVKWCHLVRTETTKRGDVVPLYQAGIDFRSVLDEKARQVLQFIESHIIVELDSRMFGRFKIDPGGDVDLGEQQDFRVRRVSLSGMLIETPFLPRLDQVFAMEIRPNGTPFDVRGRVRHVERLKSGEQGVTEVGVEFVNLDSESRRALEALIEGVIE